MNKYVCADAANYVCAYITQFRQVISELARTELSVVLFTCGVVKFRKL